MLRAALALVAALVASACCTPNPEPWTWARQCALSEQCAELHALDYQEDR